MLDDQQLFTVTDLKQFDYCARVVFYERCLPRVRPRTYKMDVGRDAHQDEQRKASRRSLAGYGLPAGERQFDLRLRSERLGLHGKLDELVMSSDGTCFPVDYKLAKQVAANHRLQLAAYALLLEDTREIRIERGYIYLIPTRKTVEVAITPKLRSAVETRLHALNRMVETEEMPQPTVVRARCFDCEFRRFCNDV